MRMLFYLIFYSYAVRGPIVTKSMELAKRLTEKKDLPFSRIINCNIGNPQSLEQRPMTFMRDVLSLVLNPALVRFFSVNKTYINSKKVIFLGK